VNDEVAASALQREVLPGGTGVERVGRGRFRPLAPLSNGPGGDRDEDAGVLRPRAILLV
jgi:hypothetical protein